MQMLQTGLLALTLAAPTLAQQKASAELFARQVGDQVQAAVRIEIEPTWYLYHTDLGDPNAIGSPLKFEWSGSDLAWQAPELPKPSVE
ncbi:MAG: hypothetical protein KDB61_08230, partial [Planctomycetes bacterium]|nr:hypothetical protein [Planctomycetota bacterium]